MATADVIARAEQYLAAFAPIEPALCDGIIRDLLALVRRLEAAPVWRCRGCGAYVPPDHGALGHTRSEHHPACDGSCRIGCPVPVACGPVEFATPGGSRHEP